MVFWSPRHMSDQTWEPSAQGNDGRGLGRLAALFEDDGVKKHVAVLSSDHVAGSCCSFNGETWWLGVHAFSSEFTA